MLERGKYKEKRRPEASWHFAFSATCAGTSSECTVFLS